MPSRSRVPMRRMLQSAALAAIAVFTHPAQSQPAPEQSDTDLDVRFATFNLQDVRTSDLLRKDQPRVRALAETIQRIRPNVLLLNEIAYDLPGGPDVPDGAEPGQNARRFVENYLAIPQAEGLEPIRYRVFMAPSNTGLPSGFDLDNDGQIVTSFPMPEPTNPDGTPGAQTDRGRAYGNDCWGFGTFPGQYGMALLVDDRLTILEDQVRTFQFFPWSYLPAPLLPSNPDGTPFYTEEELQFVRLSSKSHWDVPIRLPNGSVVHVLCSHPTPPAFDGVEQRNSKRNHDEIRFWRDYVSGVSYVVDDSGDAGGLEDGALFVVLGDLNADAEEGTPAGNPVADLLFANRRVRMTPPPLLNPPPGDGESIGASDTASWGKRADYVISSSRLEIVRSGVWRFTPTLWPQGFPSDHFPVWAEIRVPGP